MLQSGFPLDDALQGWYAQPWFLITAVVALIGIGALLANYTFNSHEFHTAPTYVPALMYTATAAVLCLVQCSVSALLANLAVLIGLNSLLHVYRQPRALGQYFLSGFWLGLAALVFPPYFTLLPGLWIAVIYTRAFNWREHLVVLLSFAVPFVYWVFWKFFYDQMNYLVLMRYQVSFNEAVATGMGVWLHRLLLFTIAATLLLATSKYLFFSDRQSNRGKAIKAVFFIIALSMLASCFFLVTFKGEWILLPLTIPFAVIGGYWYTNYRYSLVAPFLFYFYLALCAAVVFEFCR